MTLRIAAFWILLSFAFPAAASEAPTGDDAETSVGDERPPITDVAATFPYVIVTHSRLAREFERLAHFRTQGGLPARVVTLRQIRRRFRHARDDAERVRRFLQLAHDRWGTRWALIGGHDVLIPMRRVRLDVAQLSLDLPTDQYYACLDGTWNADGDALGEKPSSIASISILNCSSVVRRFGRSARPRASSRTRFAPSERSCPRIPAVC